MLKEDTEGNIWFIHEKFPAVIDLGSEKPKVIYLQELNNKLVSGFECIYPVDQNNVFLGSEKGFFHVNYEKYKKNALSISLRISAVRIYNQQDSILFGGYYSSIQDKPIQSGSMTPDIHYDWHNIHIDFTSITYGQDAGIQYSYRLVGLDDAGQGLGIALKAQDGGGRAAQVALAAVLDALGLLDGALSAAIAAVQGPVLSNWAGLAVGRIAVEPSL